jgi:hypothetical protein
LVTEPGPAEGGENYGVFPARFANIYTSRQLLQLFERAYGLFRPRDTAWQYGEAFVDPFRPRIVTGGFLSIGDLEDDRRTHLAAVRRMFEECTVFVFTLGLTEYWYSAEDGAVFPLAPGVHGGAAGPKYKFGNLSVEEVVADLRSFVAKLRVVNPTVRIILTVSPVPLVATYEDRHVLQSTTYSKAVLRVAAETLSAGDSHIMYFPSYEIITAAGHKFLATDRRSVTKEGVSRVMDLFAQHLLTHSALVPAAPIAKIDGGVSATVDQDEIAAVICDEEALAG